MNFMTTATLDQTFGFSLDGVEVPPSTTFNVAEYRLTAHAQELYRRLLCASLATLNGQSRRGRYTELLLQMVRHLLRFQPPQQPLKHPSFAKSFFCRSPRSTPSRERSSCG